MRQRGLRAARARALDTLPGGLLALALLAGPPPAHGAETAGQDLAEMDLEQLMEIEVTSVSKRAQPLSHAPAAITVITDEDIRHSGVLTLPELLRMVPGLHVAQVDANHWSVSSRGFGDEFSNKLLVLVDGRTIYEPSFSGVLWNQHDLMLEDIARIEVVRGPGGALWGANAVNGVINVITKSAKDTQGLLVSTQAGSYEKWDGAARYGFSLGDDVHARFYGKFADRREFESATTGVDANDDWQSIRAGGRIEWDVAEATLLTLQGDWFDTQADRLILGNLADEEQNTGGNVLIRAGHVFSPTQSLSLQTYFDRTDREWLLIDEVRNTYDVDLQHAFAPMPRNQVVWGVGYRRNWSDTEGSFALALIPANRKDDLWSMFAHDEITVVEDLLTLNLGSKFERNDYTGWEIQPSARVLLTPSSRYSLWAAVSRAVRTPSRLEDDVSAFQQRGPLDFVVVSGSDRVVSEDLLAYEAGLRARPVDALTVDIAAYYNDYDDLATIESGAVIPNSPFPGATTTLAAYDNQMKGTSYGVELASTLTVTDFWRLIGTYTFTKLDLNEKAGNAVTSASDVEDRTPRHQFSLRSNLNLPWNVEFDSMLYWVDRLPNQGVGAYTRLDLRLAWTPLEHLEISLAGLNLIEEHQEFNGTLTQATRVPRSVYGSVRWRY